MDKYKTLNISSKETLGTIGKCQKHNSNKVDTIEYTSVLRPYYISNNISGEIKGWEPTTVQQYDRKYKKYIILYEILYYYLKNKIEKLLHLIKR